MCLSPTLIKNVNHFDRFKGLNALKVNTYYIAVPCGTCASCIALKQSYLIQRCQLESIDNNLWFCTLTYNDDQIPVLYVNNRKIKYACKRDFQNWIKMLRKYNVFGCSFRYLVSSEFGESTHRPHWHVIFSTPKSAHPTFLDIYSDEKRLHDELLKYWRRNYGSTRKPIWKPLCTYVSRNGRRNYDFHYVNPSYTDKGCDDVGFYVTKYVLKYDEYSKRLKSGLYFNLDKERFKQIWSEVKPHSFLSKGFGDIKNPSSINYVKECISKSVKDESSLYPYFINPSTGQTFPLSPYLRKKFLQLEDEYTFYERGGALNFVNDDPKESSDYINKSNRFKKVLKRVRKRDCVDDFSNDNDTFNYKYESPSCKIIVKSNINDFNFSEFYESF